LFSRLSNMGRSACAGNRLHGSDEYTPLETHPPPNVSIDGSVIAAPELMPLVADEL